METKICQECGMELITRGKECPLCKSSDVQPKKDPIPTK